MRYQTPSEALQKQYTLKKAYLAMMRSAEQRGDRQSVGRLQDRLTEISEKICAMGGDVDGEPTTITKKKARQR